MLWGNRQQARGGPCGELTRRDQIAELNFGFYRIMKLRMS